MINNSRVLTAMQRRFSRGGLAPLSIPDYRLLLVGNFLWWGSRFMEMIALGWLVLELTDSAWQVAMIGFYRSVPFLLIGFVTGPIIDRLGRRRTILLGQSTTFAVYVVIVLLLATGRLALWHLAVGALLMGIAWSLDWPARRSYIPDLVGKTKTVDALLLENVSQNISRIAGPFAAGLVLEAFGALGAFIMLATTSGLTLLFLLGLSKPTVARPRPIKPTSPLTDLIEGLRYVGHKPAILGTLLVTLIMNFLVFPYMTLLPVFARDVLGQGPVGLGMLGAAAGIGAFAGIFVINYSRRFLSNGWIFVGGSCFQALVILAFTLSTNFYLSLALLLFSGIGQASFGIMQSSIILLSASDEMRSRAMGALVLAIGMGPVGQLQSGALADFLGAPLAVRLQSIAAIVAMVIVAMVLPGLLHKSEPVEEEATPASAYAGNSAR